MRDTNGFTNSLKRGDRPGALQHIEDLLGRGVPVEKLIRDVLAPAQMQVGERWESGEWTVEDEHAATATTEDALALIAEHNAAVVSKGHVVACCVPGERHALPGKMFAELIRAEGWRVTYLGSGMPAEHLGRYLATTRPLALAISATMAPSLSTVQVAVMNAHAAGVRVLAGGVAFGKDARVAASLGVDEWAADLNGAIAILERWRSEVASKARIQEPALSRPR
jgi:methanogenic corrinoid protein MtbC1